jgi:hypothetical protein
MIRLYQRPTDRYIVPDDFVFCCNEPLKGIIIFIKRTNNNGIANVMGSSWEVDNLWANRLVRVEVILKKHIINFYRLRRREPNDQPLITSHKFSLQQKK